MEDYNPAKGKLKRFNYWLYNELEDFVNIPGPNRGLEKLFSQISHNFITTKGTKASQKLELKANILKKIIPPTKTNSLIFWKSSTDNIHLNIVSFLTTKDLICLLAICKCFNSIFDVSKVWATLLDRKLIVARDKLGPPLNISFKEFLKHKEITSKQGTFYNSAVMIKNSSSETHELLRNLVDIVSTTNLSLTLKKCIYLKERKDFSKDLKLSLINETNEVILWVSTFEKILLASKDSKSDPEYTTRTNAFILTRYKLTDDEIITNAFFVGKRYIVIEYEQDLCADKEVKAIIELERHQINLGLKKLEQKSDETEHPIESVKYRKAKGFAIFDLNKELKSMLMHNEPTHPLKYRFFEINEDIFNFPTSSDITNLYLGFKKDSKQKYHHGTYITKQNDIQCLKEYLVIHTSSYLYFIDIDNLKSFELYHIKLDDF